MKKKIVVKVIPETKTPEMDIFSYFLPENLEGKICVGSIVDIPFGKKNIRGVVENFSLENSHTEEKYKLKIISSISSEIIIPKIYIDLARWIADYYFCTLGEAISLFLPTKTIKKIESKNDKNIFPIKNPRKLNSEQRKVYEGIINSQGLRSKKTSLIFGVTGSGKTEIYLEISRHFVTKGKQVIVLVPEIILTHQTIRKFEEVFGDVVSLMHSNLSKSEKNACYNDFYFGRKKIIIGPRSALLVPTKNLGAIIIDEEHEDAYKQDRNPRYHAVNLAEEIAKKTDAIVVLGTATPRIETYFRAKNHEIDLYELRSRYQKLFMPQSEIINMKDEIKFENYSPVSRKLFQSIEKTLKDKKQVILFLNRRGNSTFISCRECGFVAECPKCEIPLIHHCEKNSEVLRCHHCGFQTKNLSVCPVCKSSKIKFFGSGVEKIEQEIAKLFPKTKILRLDSETTKKKNSLSIHYQNILDKKYDIIIGTQIIAKGIDIHEIDLVGIISADTGLHLPHFRASEKVFRIITQVSGRSGRGESLGKTIIQSYWPESLPISSAANHNFHQFYEKEIIQRKNLNYPPFSKLIHVISENTNFNRSKSDIKSLSDELTKNNIEFIGPGLAFFQRLRGKWRHHIIIKIDKDDDKNIVIKDIWHKHNKLTWDVDPIDLL